MTGAVKSATKTALRIIKMPVECARCLDELAGPRGRAGLALTLLQAEVRRLQPMRAVEATAGVRHRSHGGVAGAEYVERLRWEPDRLEKTVPAKRQGAGRTA